MAQSKEWRIVVLGAGGVGKTCVVLRLTRSTFDPGYVPTIQDSFEKSMMYGGKNYQLKIIDTAGQDDLDSITDLAIQGGDGFVVVYSVTSEMSFGEIDRFIPRIQRLAGQGGAKAKVVLAGNKIDLAGERVVSTEQGAKKAQELQAPFVECSAATGTGVQQVFDEVLGLLVGKKAKSEYQAAEQDDKGCCVLA